MQIDILGSQTEEIVDIPLIGITRAKTPCASRQCRVVLLHCQRLVPFRRFGLFVTNSFYPYGLDRLWCYKTTSEEVGFKILMAKCNIHTRGGRISSPHLHRGYMVMVWEGVYRAGQ